LIQIYFFKKDCYYSEYEISVQLSSAIL
jgi:hypothetical protein